MDYSNKDEITVHPLKLWDAYGTGTGKVPSA